MGVEQEQAKWFLLVPVGPHRGRQRERERQKEREGGGERGMEKVENRERKW